MAGYSPLMNPAAMVPAGNVPLYMLGDVDRWRTNAMQADNAGLADAIGGYEHQQKMRPMLQQQQQLANDTTLAQLPGVQANSSMLKRKDAGEAITFDDEIKTKLGRLAREASDDDLKKFENGVHELLYSDDPAKKAQGRKLLEASKHMMQERAKHVQDMEKERTRASSAEKLMQMQIDAGRFNKAGGKVKTLEQTIAGAKSARERHQALIDASTVAKQDGNDDLAESYLARAMAVRPQAEAELAAINQKPGSVDVGTMTNGQVPTVPKPSISPQSQKPDPLGIR